MENFIIGLTITSRIRNKIHGMYLVNDFPCLLRFFTTIEDMAGGKMPQQRPGARRPSYLTLAGGKMPNTVRLSNNLEQSNHRLTGYTQMKEG